MDRLTQENSALVEENTTASQHMAEEAENLENLLNTFKVEDQGSIDTDRPKKQIEQHTMSNNKIEVQEILSNSPHDKNKETLLNEEKESLPPFT